MKSIFTPTLFAFHLRLKWIPPLAASSMRFLLVSLLVFPFVFLKSPEMQRVHVKWACHLVANTSSQPHAARGRSNKHLARPSASNPDSYRISKEPCRGHPRF